MFVVDRKDLDWQTKQEYDRFEKGAANASTSTAKLAAHLGDPDRKIVITTIQKLARLVASQKSHPIYDKHVVLIFDECHRSQFGEMHTTITRAFRRYHLFGFTGTPIFAENAGAGGNLRLKTTEQAFGGRLHTYTIVDAINDRNVLPFRIDYVNTIRTPEAIADKQVSAIDTERALLDPERDPAGRPVHPGALRPEDPPQRALPARRPPGPRLQLAVRHGLDRGREALLRGLRQERRSTCRPSSASRSGSSTRSPRTRLQKTSGSRKRASTSKRWTHPRATSSMPRSATSMRCSAPAGTPPPTVSTGTTRTSRSA